MTTRTIVIVFDPDPVRGKARAAALRAEGFMSMLRDPNQFTESPNDIETCDAVELHVPALHVERAYGKRGVKVTRLYPGAVVGEAPVRAAVVGDAALDDMSLVDALKATAAAVEEAVADVVAERATSVPVVAPDVVPVDAPAVIPAGRDPDEDPEVADLPPELRFTAGWSREELAGWLAARGQPVDGRLRPDGLRAAIAKYIRSAGPNPQDRSQRKGGRR